MSFRLKRYKVTLLFLAALNMIYLSCSDGNPTDSGNNNQEPVTVTVSPDNGMPLSVVEIIGINANSTNSDSLIVTFDGILSNLFVDSLGRFFTTIPPVIDTSTNWIDSTDTNYDIHVINAFTNDTIATGTSVFEATIPVQAPGTLESMYNDLVSITNSLTPIAELLSNGPNAQEMIIISSINAIDSLLSGSDTLSFQSQMNELLSVNPEMVPLIEALIASTGLHDHISENVALFSGLADSAQAIIAKRGANVYASDVNELISDQDLAFQMQAYVVLKNFGEVLLGPTVTSFSLILGAIGLLIPMPKFIKIVTAIASVVSFVINKLVLGAMPAKVDSLTVDFSDNVLGNNEVTNSSKFIYVSNNPTAISLLDIVGLILTSMGIVNTATSSTSSFKEIIEDHNGLIRSIINYMLGVFRAELDLYSQLNGPIEVDIETELPDLQWISELETREYIELNSSNEEILKALEFNPEWQADSQNEGEVYVTVSTSQDASLAIVPLPSGFNYTAGVFGENLGLSKTDTIFVQEPHIKILVRTGSTVTLDFDIFVFDIDENLDTIPISNAHVITSIDHSYTVEEPSSGFTDSTGIFSTGGVNAQGELPDPAPVMSVQATTPEGAVYHGSYTFD